MGGINKGERFHFLKETRDIVSYQMDEGLQYGIGLFETILIREKPYYLEEHTNRLNHSLKIFQISKTICENDVLELIDEHQLQNLALKLIVTESNQFAMVRSIPYTKKDYSIGKSLVFSKTKKSKHSQLVTHKTINYAENIFEMRKAQKRGFDDCLFCNEYGHVTESSNANVFVIIDNEIWTPFVMDGLLPGIIRQKVKENFEIKEGHISVEQVMNAQGAFMTNSLMGVMPISQIDHRKIPLHPQVNEVRRFFEKMIVG